MPEYVLNRNFSLAEKGHMIYFTKGQPTFVPPILERAAVAIGAEPVDGPKIDPLEPEAPPPPAEMTPEDRYQALKAAFELIVERNSSDDFGGDGKPTVDAVKALVEFSPSKKEILAAWQRRIAEQAE